MHVLITSDHQIYSHYTVTEGPTPTSTTTDDSKPNDTENST